MKSWHVNLALAAACVLAFAPGVSAPLNHYDDSLYIYKNTELLGGPLAPLWDSSRAWRGEFVEFFPLRDTVYWAVFQFADTRGWPYHVVNVLFHVLATLLVRRFTRLLGFSEWVANATAFLFAVHPIHIESVLWAAGLKDPMYTSLMLASLMAYATYRTSLRPLHYGLSLGFLVLSLLVKSMAIATPLLMLAMEAWTEPRASWRLRLLRVAGPGMICALFFAQFVAIGHANHAVVPPHGGTWMTHFILAAWAQVKYLKQVFIPSSFRLIYCFEPPTGLSDWRLWVAVAVAIVLVVVLVRSKSPVVRFAAAWHFACLLPVSNLVPFPAVMADRYLYAASFGGLLLVAWALEKFAVERFARARNIIAAAVVVVLCATSAVRSTVWQNEDALWEEPDLDAACMVDTAYPAAHAHLLRSWTAPTRAERLMALERALLTPGMYRLAKDHYCEILVVAASETAILEHEQRAEPWARQAARDCPESAATWNAVTIVNLHRRLEVAALAAEKAYRLNRGVDSNTLRALTRIELKKPATTEDGQRILREAIAENPALACPSIEQWQREVEPALRVEVQEALELCAAAVKEGRVIPAQPDLDAPTPKIGPLEEMTAPPKR